jgi:hypothetical protein
MEMIIGFIGVAVLIGWPIVVLLGIISGRTKMMKRDEEDARQFRMQRESDAAEEYEAERKRQLREMPFKGRKL